MAVYLIQAGDAGPVKIGFTENVAGRLIKMQADNHEPLRVLALYEGDKTHEATLHELFASVRLAGEWFAASVAGAIPYIRLPRLAYEPKTAADVLTVREILRAAKAHDRKDARITLRDWVASEGLTQEQAAERINVHPITLNRWLNGKAMPQPKVMRRIQSATGGQVQPNSFFSAQETA